MEQYRQVTAMTVMEETMNQEQSIQQRASPKIRCDAFLATDAIGTEIGFRKYNTNVFMFGDSDLRKLMADIQVEAEQNHAEMLYINIRQQTEYSNAIDI